MAAKIRFLFGMAARAVAFALSGGAQPVPPQAIHRVSPRPEGLGGAAPPPCCPLRCFLTRRIDYFRAPALSLANTRKSETSDVQAHPSDSPPHGRLKMVFSPLYGTFRPHFSSEKWPWIEISIPWIGESMGFGRRWASALTVCHIAHRGGGPARWGRGGGAVCPWRRGRSAIFS